MYGPPGGFGTSACWAWITPHAVITGAMSDWELQELSSTATAAKADTVASARRKANFASSDAYTVHPPTSSAPPTPVRRLSRSLQTNSMKPRGLNSHRWCANFRPSDMECGGTLPTCKRNGLLTYRLDRLNRASVATRNERPHHADCHL